MPSKIKLAYLFRAYFADGSTFDQNKADRARLDHARKGTGSSYTDLLHLLEVEGKQLVAFALCTRDGQAIAAVHLDDGHFELGGNGFWTGDDCRGPLSAGVERRLIYYRSMLQIATTAVVDGEPSGKRHEETRVSYFFGWQVTTPDGRNVQHVLGFDQSPDQPPE
jgi:hypothetical protein